MTYGIPNSVLAAHEIDPEILQDLPEDMRVELLSTIDWQPAQQQVPEPQANLNEYGLDVEFLASLPEEMRNEIIEGERRRRQQEQEQAERPAREAENMDVASIIATVSDP